MLAGLLFAIHDADDQPDRLAATLPFGGLTLIEYQARLLIAAGAAQIILIVARATPELLGAISRIGRRGVAVDAVRSAAEAAEKIHPLARVLMIADGLVTTEGIVAGLAQEGGDALLVVPETDAPTGFERVGGQMAWAGVARLEPGRIAEVARLPRDYDVQSTLIRVAAQARAAHVELPVTALRDGHGIEHHAGSLDRRSRTVLAASVAGRRGWFDRYVLAPVARWTLPLLVYRKVPGEGVAAAGAILGGLGLFGIASGFAATGLIAVLLATMTLALGATLGDLRDQPRLVLAERIAAVAMPLIAILLFGWAVRAATEDGAPLASAITLAVLAGLGERAIPSATRRSWWGSPSAHLVVVTVSAMLGVPMLGLAVASIYAAVTLADAIEKLRQQP
ncbi:hypothetical protein [Sphingomonas sp.]|jgi:hypothetical protein|uniref:hypothetical protein n=1 Tax=Sphingomonas sp. TaxID=28214 RepID=UPI002ED7BB44